MQKPEVSQAVGSLRISQDVIATIASRAALEIEGVAALTASSGKIKNLFLKNALLKAISINLSDDVAVIDIGVTLKYGANIPTVCEALQNAVKQSVQSMTGITVSKVNVKVSGVLSDESAS